MMVNWIMQCVTTAAFTLNINGERIGYFRGGRGLRQGDPISSYQFTLIMEVFSLLLQREIENEPKFQYHFGCKAIKLSHVCFAGDLLVMCYGDTTFVKVIKKALDDFSAYSGLFPNNSKSTMFFGSLKEEEMNAIRSVLRFAIGKLLTRYLGVPLIAKRFGIKECGPKDQGGLGLKNLHLWNKALLAKHVWNIATKKDTLWVKWFHAVKLRGSSIWDISVENEDSWGWKNLISIRDQIKDHVYEKFPMVTSLVAPRIDDQSEDTIVWKANNREEVDFTVRQCIPKHSFILWLAIQGRLTTLDKLSIWGNQAVNRCCLCLNAAEDLNHLFFQCSFSKEVWNKSVHMAEFKGNMTGWDNIIQAIIEAGCGNNINSVVRRLVFTASVYNICQEGGKQMANFLQKMLQESTRRIITSLEVILCIGSVFRTYKGVFGTNINLAVDIIKHISFEVLQVITMIGTLYLGVSLGRSSDVPLRS
ncbi:RNA-directed DNA polymerase, eukaryota, reverse transcriptase zinc-binding domain protein [Tanacetum coccineum]